MSRADMTTSMTPATTACPCCRMVDVLLPSPAYTRCTCCGHRWRMSSGVVGARYYEALVARNDLQTPWFKRKIADRVAALSALLTPQVERVLEVGCAEGALGEAIKARFPLAYDGLELSQDRELARARLDQVFQTYANQVESQPYDLIVSFHVLEHIPDPAEELRAWSRLLATGGKLLIEVPHQAGHPLLDNDRNPEHLHQFTPASLTVLLAHCGLTCHELSLGHYESPVYPDSIRVIAQPRRQPDELRAQLVQRFEKLLGGPFIAYAIGGDFLNYVAPLADALDIRALVDSAASKWGQQVGSHIVSGYDEAVHGALPILVCSIKFGAGIRQQLLAAGIAADRIIGLETVYEGA